MSRSNVHHSPSPEGQPEIAEALRLTLTARYDCSELVQEALKLEPSLFLSFVNEQQQLAIESWRSLCDRFGEEALIDTALSDSTFSGSFYISVPGTRIAQHFERPENRTLEELARVLKLFDAPEAAARIIRMSPRSWSGDPGAYAELLPVLLAWTRSYPVELREVIRDWGHLAQSEDPRTAAACKSARRTLSDYISEDPDLFVPIVNSLIREVGREILPLEVGMQLSKALLSTGVVGSINAHMLHRTALDPKTPEPLREVLLTDIARFRDAPLPRELQHVYEGYAQLPPERREVLLPFLQAMDVGLQEPNTYTTSILTARGVAFLTEENYAVNLERLLPKLEALHAEFAAIPRALLLPVYGQLDGDAQGLRRCNELCTAIANLPGTDARRCMNSLRRAVTDFYVYKHSLLGPLLAASGIEQITSAKEAASFCDFIDRYLPLASLCHYSGKPIALPHEGESWESRALQCEAHFQRLWPVYCSNRREIDPQNILRGMDFENHPFLLSLAAFAEAHWIHNNLDTFRSALELIAALDAPRFEKFRQWRYDRTNETIARQLQPLSDLQHPLWQNDYVSPSLPGKDGARLRLLVTDCPALLLFAGETPLHTNSCLIHTGNPDLNGPLLSLMADAHQKMALLLDERSLPTELVDDPSSPLEPHADAIRRACLCRSVIKLAEDTKGAPGIVLSPTYHPAGQRSRQNEAHLQAALLDWSQNSLGIRVFSRPRSGSATETFFVPSSRFPIGQNEDFDGMTWSTAMKGRIALMLSPLG